MEVEKQIERDMKRELNIWLLASFTNATHNDAILKRLPDTCDWIMDRDEFCDWLSPDFPSESAKVLWIPGPAGYGKTVLTARVVQNLTVQKHSNLAVFFFSSDLENRADPFIVARSWISQMISANSEAFELACEKLDLQNNLSASSSEVMDLFKEIVQKVPSCTFIVDGLDECSSKRTWSTTQNICLGSFIRIRLQSMAGTRGLPGLRDKVGILYS
ncbi:hypothetical protein BX600DRAFT_502966 [Xylariales sp. PMI_506]|nr:hypothetical protein BX600DRAFT_502966 [Xylariales sp. PMI_506]